jgi:sigma-B regulation protein RsbU (phosphoserine phosphatase)
MPAGHDPLLVYKASVREVIALNTGGFPIGMKAFTQDHIDKQVLKNEAFIKQHSLTLEPGDCIIYYTDGITEAMNQERKIMGLENFKKHLQLYCSNIKLSPADIIERIMGEVDLHTGGKTPHDDISMIVARVV